MCFVPVWPGAFFLKMVCSLSAVFSNCCFSENKIFLWFSDRSADGVIYVVDSADRERIEEARIELLRLVKGQNNPSCLPTLLLANKQDLPESMSPEEVGKVMSVNELSGSQQCAVMPVCSITGEGLSDAIDCMVDMIKKWRKGKGKHAR